MLSGHALGVSLGERQQCFRLLNRSNGRQIRKQRFEVRVRFDAVRLSRLDQAVQIRAGVRAGDRVSEEPVFPAHDKRPHRVLGEVIPLGQASRLSMRSRPSVVYGVSFSHCL